MPVLFLLLIIAVPVAELAVIIQVGQWLGLWPTLALLIADSILGAWLMRSQGRRAWQRFNETLAQGRAPAREVLDGALVIVGGAFLLTPGFLSDIVGALLLVPPTRALLRRMLLRRLGRGATVRFGPLGRTGAGPPWGSRPGSAGYDVDGSASEVDQRRLP